MGWEYGDGVDWSTGCLLCLKVSAFGKKRYSKVKGMGKWGWKGQLDESIRPIRCWWVRSGLCPKRSLLKWVYRGVEGRSGWNWKVHGRSIIKRLWVVKIPVVYRWFFNNVENLGWGKNFTGRARYYSIFYRGINYPIVLDTYMTRYPEKLEGTLRNRM